MTASTFAYLNLPPAAVRELLACAPLLALAPPTDAGLAGYGLLVDRFDVEVPVACAFGADRRAEARDVLDRFLSLPETLQVRAFLVRTDGTAVLASCHLPDRMRWIDDAACPIIGWPGRKGEQAA